jgi:hypothetical protein
VFVDGVSIELIVDSGVSLSRISTTEAEDILLTPDAGIIVVLEMTEAVIFNGGMIWFDTLNTVGTVFLFTIALEWGILLCVSFCTLNVVVDKSVVFSIL